MEPMSLNEALLATVRAEAAARKVSLKDLAAKSGIKPGTMANYTNRGRTMNSDVIEKLAAGLEMTPERLVQLAADRRRELGRAPSQVSPAPGQATGREREKI